MNGLGFAAPVIAASAAGGPVTLAISLAITGVTTAIKLFLSRKGPKQKEATSSYANEIESYMVANLRAFSESTNKNYASKQQALQNFDELWARLASFCGDPQMGKPGRNCIEERDNIPGSSTGNDWNWFKLYRDPIANFQTEDEGNMTVRLNNMLTTATTGNGGNGGNNGSNDYGGLILIGIVGISVLLLVKEVL